MPADMTQSQFGTSMENTETNIDQTASGMNMAHMAANTAGIVHSMNTHPTHQSLKFYGYFTANKYKSKRANYDIVNTICENYEKIRDDLDDWYDVIF